MKFFSSTLLAVSLLTLGAAHAGNEKNITLTPAKLSGLITGLLCGGGFLEKQTGFWTKFQDKASDNPYITTGILAASTLGVLYYNFGPKFASTKPKSN